MSSFKFNLKKTLIISCAIGVICYFAIFIATVIFIRKLSYQGPVESKSLKQEFIEQTSKKANREVEDLELESKEDVILDLTRASIQLFKIESMMRERSKITKLSNYCESICNQSLYEDVEEKEIMKLVSQEGHLSFQDPIGLEMALNLNLFAKILPSSLLKTIVEIRNQKQHDLIDQLNSNFVLQKELLSFIPHFQRVTSKNFKFHLKEASDAMKDYEETRKNCRETNASQGEVILQCERIIERYFDHYKALSL